MADEVVGEGVVLTEDQRRQLTEAAETIHINNLNKTKVTPEQAHKDTIEESFTRREVSAFLKAKAAEAANTPKPLNKVNIDDLADEKKVEEEKKVTKKAKVPVATSEAPVDYDLLQREMKTMPRRSREEARDAYVEQYRKRMREEKEKWERSMMRDLYKGL